MNVKAKFKCDSLNTSKTQYGEQKTVHLYPSNSKEGDNKDWSQYTPNGKLEMTITNVSAYDYFVPGKSYFLTFEVIEDTK